MIASDIADFNVKRVLIDGGSTKNVLTWKAFVGLKIFPENLKVVYTLPSKDSERPLLYQKELWNVW